MPGCGFVAKYQNTSNLENHYVTAGTDQKELADRLTSLQYIDMQDGLGSAADGRIACLAHLSLLLSQQTRSLTVTSSLSSGLFERIGLCQVACSKE